jgi:hypothetical protein
MTDAAYYAQREQAERALAQSAKDASVRNIHLLLADKYAELIKQQSVLEPFGIVRAA